MLFYLTDRLSKKLAAHKAVDQDSQDVHQGCQERRGRVRWIDVKAFQHDGNKGP